MKKKCYLLLICSYLLLGFILIYFNLINPSYEGSLGLILSIIIIVIWLVAAFIILTSKNPVIKKDKIEDCLRLIALAPVIVIVIIPIELYSELTDLNNKAVIEAIEEAPYLAHFIKEDTELIKSPKTLITNAVKKFNESKVKFQKQFCEALESKNITSEKFKDAVEKINIIAAAELGEYILYKENIIKALKQALVNYDSKEKFVHDMLPQ